MSAVDDSTWQATWAATSALLRGDRTGAALLVEQSHNPAVVDLYAGELARVLRVYSTSSGTPPWRLQEYLTDILATLAVEAAPVEGGV